MAKSVTLSGTLIDGMSKPIPGAVISLYSLVNGMAVGGTVAEATTGTDGKYSFVVPVGVFFVRIYVDGQQIALPGKIHIYPYSGNGTLQEYLYAPVGKDLTPMFLMQLEIIRQEVEANAAAAAKSETDAEYWAGIAASSAAAGAEVRKVYTDVAAGQAAITAGTIKVNEVFAVLSPSNDNSLDFYYNNNGTAARSVVNGVAKSYPSPELVKKVINLIPEYNLALLDANVIPLIAVNDKVVLWLDNGNIESAVGLGPNLRNSLISSISGYLLTVIGKDLNDSQVIPLVMIGNSVVLWYENGDVCSASFKETSPRQSTDPYHLAQWDNVVTNAISNLSLKAKLAKIKNGVAGSVAKVLVTGDSWTDYFEIPNTISKALYDEYGYTSDGWCGVGLDTNRITHLNGMKVVRTGNGWTQQNIHTNPAAFGLAIDGYCVIGVDASCQMQVSEATGTDITIFYNDSGAFRYNIDGGAWVDVPNGATGTVKSIKSTGNADAKHTVTIDCSPIQFGESVVIYGLYFDNPAKSGIQYIKSGCSGARADEYQRSVVKNIGAIIPSIAPDLVIVILGTNDYHTSISPIPVYVAGQKAIFEAYKSAYPNCCVLFVAPSDTNVTGIVSPLRDYCDALRDYCLNNGAEFADINKVMPSWAKSNEYGLFRDSAHHNENGARVIYETIHPKFFKG